MTRLLFLVVSLASPMPAAGPNAPDGGHTQKQSSVGARGVGVAVGAEKAHPVRVPRISQPPIIDGTLDDEAWKSAAVFRDFVQVEPGDNIPPSKQTEVRVAYDARFLYIAFRADDDPRSVRATVAKRDAILEDDHVGVFLDTFDDRRKAYALYFNPFGVQQDGIFSEGAGDDFSVDVVMDSNGRIDETGYVVEVAIPFKSLRYKAGADARWGVHFFRRIKRFNNELSSWMPLSRDISGKLAQEGGIVGLEGLASEYSLEIIPSLTLTERGNRARALSAGSPVSESSRFVNGPVKVDPGLSLKFGISSDLTLDFAANPDFAQVEADQPVVTANERFPIFFAEKRPFFLEGIDIFQTPIQVVHTRTIVDPDYAAKVTGKQGRNSFGILVASDRAPGNFSEEERTDPNSFPSIERFIDKNSYVGVLRFKRDLGKESSVGFLGSSYNFIERHNHVAGFDGRFRINQQTFFSFQLVGSHSRALFFDPSEGIAVYRNGNGLGYYWDYDRKGRHFSYNLNGVGYTSDYRAFVGFTRRLNHNKTIVTARYDSEPNPDARLVSWKIASQSWLANDWQGRVQNSATDPSITFNFRNQTSLRVLGFFGFEKLYEEEFGPKRTAVQQGAFIGESSERGAYYRGIEVGFEATPSKKYSIDLTTFYGWGLLDLDLGGGPRYPRASPGALLDPDAPLDPGPGNQWFFTLTFTLQPTDELRTSVDYTKSRLVRWDTGLVAFDSNVFSSRTTYQFTRFTFARVRLDFDSQESNALGQFLLGWTPNPGTSFYAGYNDDLNYNGFSPLTGRLEPGFRRNNRTFFVKMTYLFRRNL